MASKKPSKKLPQIEQIKPGHPDYLQPATKEVFEMMDKGLTPTEATKLIKNKDNLSKVASDKIKKKYARYSLTKPSIVKLAHTAIKDTLNMTEVNEVKPSYTNRIAAAQMVMDRAEPVIKVNHNLNVNAQVDPVDLSAYMSR